MQRSNFFADQRVTDSDLNNIETSKSLEIRQRLFSILAPFAHTFQGQIAPEFQRFAGDSSPTVNTKRGVIGNLGSADFTVSINSATEFVVNSGFGITDNMDLVKILTPVTVDLGQNDFNVTWPAVNSVPMYVSADYQEASSSIAFNSAGQTFFRRYFNNYHITVSSSQPNGLNQIPIAQFSSDGSGHIVSGSMIDRRDFIRVNTTDDVVRLSGTNVFSGQNTVYDHIHSVGSGVPASNNPHGISITDIQALSEAYQQDSTLPFNSTGSLRVELARIRDVLFRLVGNYDLPGNAWNTPAEGTIAAIVVGNDGNAGSPGAPASIGTPNNIKSLANQFSDINDATSARQIATNASPHSYSNLTGRTMFVTVSVFVNSNTASGVTIQLSTDNFGLSTIPIATVSFTSSQLGHCIPVQFYVPPDYYYRVLNNIGLAGGVGVQIASGSNGGWIEFT